MTETDHRAAVRRAWACSTLGDPGLQLQSASADASFRSYWRAQQGSNSWIVMDSPPALEDPRPWLEMSARLATAGLHVPAVYAQDLEQGFLLIEDLGNQLYLPALNERTADALYGDALSALLRMQRDVDVGGLAPYNREFLSRELELMPEWFLGKHLGYTPTCEMWDVLEAAFTTLLTSALAQPRCFVHRDYHSRNLLIVDAQRDVGAPTNLKLSNKVSATPTQKNPAIIDFQGALLGPITYDLASLLRDCYIVWERERVEGWVESYRQQLLAAQLIGSDIDGEHFLRWFDLMGLQRHLKVLGIFCRLYYRDGKRSYLNDLPRVYNYVIDVARRYPELNEMVALLERVVGQRDLRVEAA
ncbi:MAG: phosphotransferase [Rhodanobacter sp.]